MRGRVAIAALLVLAVLGAASAALRAQETDAASAAESVAAPPTYHGMPLAEALADLQRRGLGVIFSSDLVKPHMRVRSEPTATSLPRVLDEMLAPHGLESEVGPRGSVLVVLRDPEPILVAIEEPSPFKSVFGETEVKALVMTEEPIRRVEFYVDEELVGTLSRPPYELLVDVGEENVDREFRVLAWGRWGGFGRASMTTRRLEVADQFEVALKQLFVTVDQSNRRVLDLGRQHFNVFDGGVKQQLVTFERGDVPITAVVLLDASESMRGRYLEAALAGSQVFLSAMNPLDEAMVMLFADRALAVTPFSSDAGLLMDRLSGVVARGGTALNDHLYASLRLLDRMQGRRVVILLSDGADVLSVLRMRDVIWKVRRSDALIYWIRLQQQNADFSSAWRSFQANREEWEGLERAVRESGGAVQILDAVEEIEPAFEQIMAELRSQYVLGYYPSRSESDGSWRPVRVKVSIPAAKVRFRAGYIDR